MVAARALKPGGHVIAPEPGAKDATDDSSAEEACADAGADTPQPAVIYRPSSMTAPIAAPQTHRVFLRSLRVSRSLRAEVMAGRSWGGSACRA